MADISKITIPSGATYNIKDTVARNRMLPTVTTADNNKTLRVDNGEWTVASPVYTIGRKRYYFNSIEVSAGAVGSRGRQVSVPYDIDGVPPILGIHIAYISDSSACIPVVFTSGNTIYLNLYRTSTSACTVSVEIIVSYLEENWND